MPDNNSAGPQVERLFPFVIRSRGFIVGRDALARSRKKLHFILITTDISEGSSERVRSDFRELPVIQRYTSAEIEKHFQLKGTKVLGFKKSSLSASIFKEFMATERGS